MGAAPAAAVRHAQIGPGLVDAAEERPPHLCHGHGVRRRRAAQVRLAACRIHIVRDGAHVEVRPEAADGEARRAFVGVDALEDDVVLGLGEGDEEELEGLLGHRCPATGMQPFLAWVLELEACFAEHVFG